MLEAAALLCVLAAVLSHGSDRQDQINVAIAIVGVVLLNATIGFFQEYRAEKATEALQKMVPANAKVVRDGEVTIVAVADLVPGDVVQLEEGDSISADARLIRQYEMSTINIALTGESDAVRKTADSIVEEELATINMPNLVFMGTSVASGTGQAVVFATGLNTEFGHIFTLTGGVSDEKSPLQREIDVMARTVSIIAVICGIALFFAALSVFKFGDVKALLFALGVMVALVPEGLPATLSVALAIGVQRMAKENALIKKLMGVETLGSTNVICTDKTGTLTKAEMTVKEMFAGDTVVEVTGAGYEPVGEFVVGDTTLPKDEARRRLELLLRAMSFANDAKVLRAERRQGLAGDRRSHRRLPAGGRPEGRLRPLRRARRAPQDLRAALRVGAQAHVGRARRGRRPEGLRQGRAVRDHPALHGRQARRQGRAHDRRAARPDRRAQRRHVAPGAARAGRRRARPAGRPDRLHARLGRDRAHLPRPRRHDRPAAARGQRGRRARPHRRHPHHHGDRRLRSHGRGDRPAHRHRARRPQRAGDHRHRPGRR